MCAATKARAPTRRRAAGGATATIPAFSLYGETDESGDDGAVHIEGIAARSERYDWEIDSHLHHGLCQILVVISGAVTVRLDDAELEPPAPCAVLVPPASVHAFRFRPGTLGSVLTFAEARFAHAAPERSRLLAALFAAPAVVDLGGDDGIAARLERLLGDIEAEFHGRPPRWTTLIEAALVAVLVLLARRHVFLAETATSPEADLHARFRALVEAHVADHLAVGTYADRLGVTESRLDRAVRAVTGRSAFEMVQDRLLLEARRKLIYIAAPVSKLAYELGFDDPAYFWRFFRRRTGMTPTEFRRAERRRADAD